MSRGFLLGKWLAKWRNGGLVYSAFGRVLSYRKAFIVFPLLTCYFALVRRAPRAPAKKKPRNVFRRGLGAGPPLLPVSLWHRGHSESQRRSSAIAPSVRDISAQCSDPMLYFERIQLTIESAAAEQRWLYPHEVVLALEKTMGTLGSEEDQPKEMGMPCFILCNKSASGPYRVH